MTTISRNEADRAGNSTGSARNGALRGDVAAALAAGVTVNGTSGNDIITPTETVPGQPFAGDDDDTIHGLAGNDTIDGGGGADLMYGGTGDDTYYVDNTGDRVFELQGQAQGRDRVFSSVSYSLAGQFIETLTLTGDTNINALGNSQANILVGNIGDNVLDGKGGVDVMRGGAGNDIYDVDNIGDVVDETDGAGGDAGGHDIVASSISFTLESLANVEDLTLNFSTDAIVGTGNDLDNVIHGNRFANTLYGNAGNDTLTGWGGGDSLYGGDGNDILFGRGDNNIFENRNDRLYGDAGEDLLTGWHNLEQMTGGADADIFKFFIGISTGISSSLASMDTILDFNREEGDLLQVSKTAMGTLAFYGEVSTPDFTLTEGATLSDDDIDPGYTQLWSYRDEEAVTTYLIGDVNNNRTLDSTDLVVALTGPTAPLGLAESDFVDGTFVALG